MKPAHSVPKHFDNLVYLDDYIDTIEAVPLDLQRNFTLMRELDGYAQELMDTASRDAIELIDNIKDMDPNSRLDKLKNLTSVLTETLKRGEEKVALAKSTFDAVDRHCNRLDADLVKFEEDQTVGDSRITTLPGLQPSARSLKEGADVRERATKRLERERKDPKGEKKIVKKRKTAKESTVGNGVAPPSPAVRAQALKESKNVKNVEKEKTKNSYNTTKNGNGKPKMVVPVDLPIDPNEPLYCYCQQVSYGEMVACDNTDCEIEWFHLACVDLKTVPKGKWFCNQFLREAIQILKHADNSLNKGTILIAANDTEQDKDDNEEQDNAITWQLKLTPTMMTLDTSILTVSGLEKVLELIRINVKPQPPKLTCKKTVNSDRFNSIFRHIIEPVLRLSNVMTVPRLEQLEQYHSMQLMRHCVQCFIDCGYSFFLDVPSLIANTDMILSQPGAAKEHTVETLLILSICTLMIHHTTIHHRGMMSVANALMHAYYAQARQLLQDLFDVHHISVVQSMFILSLFPHGHMHLFSQARLTTPLLTMAIRMALAMDLHKLDTQHTKESDQKERLRRLGWMLLCADYYADFNTTGRTGLIDAGDWHVDFPQPLPTEISSRRVEFFSQYCRIVMLRKLELLKSAYMVSLQSPKALESGLDDQLFQAYFNTPDTFKLDFDRPNQAWNMKSHFESLLLHELYCHSQIFARVPFIPKRYFDSFIKDEDASRCADLNDIHQRIVRAADTTNTTLPFTKIDVSKLSTTAKFATEKDHELEIYVVVGCLTILNNYTLILEALTYMDTIGCHHSPVYGIMLTTHLYLIIERSYQIPEVKSLCQINLNRSLLILRRARTIFADPAILFIERMLTRHNISPTEDTPICTLDTRTHEIVRSLQAKASYLHHNYDDFDDDDFVKQE
ncbi:hypothetical protein [Parasitella parasitica]|uniref:Inhibitor of growth protein N-terminal histone-binding domain-containing protein n=1 Tax=Parasitella parasitica TaxID=35722 RepID=A0A0B7MZH8_9FUNG|nr:hypothetical protein [Parasitella parasitica]